ncbi:hypothetical protein DFH06DRAFT_1133531 [Mycena polygramma]|nr:hypothetical protein DFH06DRAFT_1133531 [Mycena polygramma]
MAEVRTTYRMGQAIQRRRCAAPWRSYGVAGGKVAGLGTLSSGGVARRPGACTGWRVARWPQITGWGTLSSGGVARRPGVCTGWRVAVLPASAKSEWARFILYSTSPPCWTCPPSVVAGLTIDFARPHSPPRCTRPPHPPAAPARRTRPPHPPAAPAPPRRTCTTTPLLLAPSSLTGSWHGTLPLSLPSILVPNNFIHSQSKPSIFQLHEDHSLYLSYSTMEYFTLGEGSTIQEGKGLKNDDLVQSAASAHEPVEPEIRG